MKRSKISKTEMEIYTLIHSCETSQINLMSGDSVTDENGAIKFTRNPNLVSRNPDLKFVMHNSAKQNTPKFKNKMVFEIIFKIGQDLCYLNPLWICNDKNKSQVKKALKELEKYNYLKPIYGTNIYYVNPHKISYGNSKSIIYALSYHLLLERKSYLQITESDVKPLKQSPNGFKLKELDHILIMQLSN